jgi:hypothetical protein
LAGKITYDLKTLTPNIEEFLSRCDAFLQVNKDTDVSNFVGDCKKVILDPRLKIFTTNYDLCFERAAGDLGLVVIDGFSFMQLRNYDSPFFWVRHRRTPTCQRRSRKLP